MLSELPFRGYSMWPLLKSGDQVLVEYFTKPRQIREFEIGEILLHKDSGEWTVHRVVAHKNRKVLKGDFANSYLYDDQQIVWGRVRGFERDGKRVEWSNSHRFSELTASLSQKSLVYPGAQRKANKFAMFLLAKLTLL